MRLMLGAGFGPATEGWSIRSVRVNGVDVTDAGIEFKPNEDISGVEVELTNKVTTIAGTVKSSRGELSTEYTAIVFAQDKEKWTGNSRYQSAGRPDQDGRFKITGCHPASTMSSRSIGSSRARRAIPTSSNASATGPCRCRCGKARRELWICR
jgi:hypothetical protein